MSDGLHDDELALDIDLVRRLVDGQCSEYAALPLTKLATSGSTNALFRLGDALLVRLPRQSGAGASIDKEARWVATMSARLPVAVPEVVVLGEPDRGYPERWSVVRWLDGELPRVWSPGGLPTRERALLAADLADVVQALRAINPPESAAVDESLRSYRGCALEVFDRQTRLNIETCRTLEGFDLDLDAALAMWTDALTLPSATDAGPHCWFHGDLVAENLLLRDGRLSAVLDFGGLGVGDPTVDLHGAWELFDAPARATFRARVGASDAEWLRGRAWALAISISALSYYWHTLPSRRRDRLAMARAVLDDNE